MFDNVVLMIMKSDICFYSVVGKKALTFSLY